MDNNNRNVVLKEILTERLVATQTRITAFKKDMQDLKINHPDQVDMSQANTDREIIDAELRQLDRNENAYKVALKRIEADTYGYCKNPDCEVDIPLNRLKSVPTTEYCTDCLSIEEGKLKHYA